MTKLKNAPDEGPLSSAHHFLKARTYPTILVKKKAGGFARIRSERFNPERHEKVEEKKGRASLGDTATTPDLVTPDPVTPHVAPVKFGKEPKEELLTWTRDELLGLPELAFINEPPGDKNVLVDMIFSVREQREKGQL